MVDVVVGFAVGVVGGAAVVVVVGFGRAVVVVVTTGFGLAVVVVVTTTLGRAVVVVVGAAVVVVGGSVVVVVASWFARRNVRACPSDRLARIGTAWASRSAAASSTPCRDPP